MITKANVKMPANYGVQTPPSSTVAYPGTGFPNYGNDMEVKVKRKLGPTPSENATLEAENGETVITNLQKDGIPEFYTIGGKRHYAGGTPLNLPPNSFLFSRDKSLKITDPTVLKMFGKSGKNGVTPADLSKTYDINKYREILANGFTDKFQKETAELMIKNYNLKLGALALVQEAKKGFENGIPMVAMPYMESLGINPDELLLGANPPSEDQVQQFRDGGSYQPRRRVVIDYLPQYRDGNEVPNSGNGASEVEVKKVPVKKQNIPAGAVIHNADAPDYDKTKVKAGEYILKNGVYSKVTGFKARTGKADLVKDDRLGAFTSHYAYLVEKFQDTKFRDAFVKQYQTELANVKPNGKLTQQDIDDAKALSPDDIIKNFLYKTKVNYAVNNSLGDLSEADKKNLWDHNANLSQEAAVKLGYKARTPMQIGAFQAGYIGLNNMIKNPEYKDLTYDIGAFQTGLPNDTVNGTTTGSISKIDGWDGNTTSGQIASPRGDEPVFEDVPYDEVTDPTVTPEAKKDPIEEKKEQPAKWWTQDLVNMAGAMGDLLTAKKYEPWQATPDFTPAEPTFTDFRGTAARIGSQGNALAENAATFASPQNYGAIAASIQKGMVDPILQTQEAENRANVGVDNQFEMFNAQAKNNYDTGKAALDTALYDKGIIANQQFDNTKRALRQNVRDTFNRGWTNKGMTQTLNALYDNQYTDPTTGYTKYIKPTGDIKANKPTMSYAEEVFALMDKYKLDQPEAERLVRGNRGYFDSKTKQKDDEDPLNAAQFAYPG